MRARAFADLSQLSDPDFFQEIAEGLQHIARNVAAIDADCGHRPPSTGVHAQTGPVRICNLRVGTCTDPTGSDSHRSGSEAIERVSQLSLVLTPRCPRFGGQTRGG